MNTFISIIIIDQESSWKFKFTLLYMFHESSHRPSNNKSYVIQTSICDNNNIIVINISTPPIERSWRYIGKFRVTSESENKYTKGDFVYTKQ